MLRIDAENAVKMLVNNYLATISILKDNGVTKSKKEVDAEVARIKELINNEAELKNELQDKTDGQYTLKGTRGATNISFADEKTQKLYGKAEELVGKIVPFKGKNGDIYNVGVYCKKVVSKQKK
tara:strand:- start:406 stop:777 length:372 start_codon:yes stop_codon:yes gene_type:complete